MGSIDQSEDGGDEPQQPNLPPILAAFVEEILPHNLDFEGAFGLRILDDEESEDYVPSELSLFFSEDEPVDYMYRLRAFVKDASGGVLAIWTGPSGEMADHPTIVHVSSDGRQSVAFEDGESFVEWLMTRSGIQGGGLGRPMRPDTWAMSGEDEELTRNLTAAHDLVGPTLEAFAKRHGVLGRRTADEILSTAFEKKGAAWAEWVRSFVPEPS